MSTPPTDAPLPLDDARRAVLLGLAREAILEPLGRPPTRLPPEPWAQQPAATFVTLEWPDGRLQGCIGNLAPDRPLVESVRANARAAAFEDPRNRPLDATRAAALTIGISVLSPLEPLHFDDETSALAQLRPGVDGAVLSWGRHRGTFLPQVWDSLPEPQDFWRELKRKAGLPPDFWDPELRLARYQVDKWSSDEPRFSTPEPP